MGGKTADTLRLELAKQQLRTSVGDLSLQAWVRRRPTQALLSAMVAGMVFGGHPERSAGVLKNLLFEFLRQR